MSRNYRGRKPKSEFDQQLVDLARVTRVVAGGRRFRFRATVVIGNRKGKVGFGIAKGQDVSRAVNKATEIAKKNIVEITIVNDTIPHELQIKKSGANIIFKPARPGTGIIAGGAVRPVIELSGIKNIISKMIGSSSKVNNVQATISALTTLATPDELEKRRGGKKVRGTFQRVTKAEQAKKPEDKPRKLAPTGGKRDATVKR